MIAEAKRVATTPVFQRNLAAYQQGYPIICNEGGSRSSKSYSIIQLLCGIAKNEPGKRISIVSHSLPHIKRGAFRDFKQIMQEIGWWKEDHWRATDFVYHFPNKSYIELFGLEDEGKARGPGRDILFVNEANLISKTLFDQLAMRTTGQIFLDWNPADFNSWVYAVADNPANKRIHSTYKDNIHNLTQAQIDYIEGYKNLPDDFMWKVYGLGQRGAAKELIYTNWKYYNDEPQNGEVFYGLDFGYTNPSALVKVRHYEGANYVEESLYRSSLTVPELINHLKALGITRSDVIYADAAEPKTIEEIFKAGFNIKPSDKDVWAGIVAVKSYPLFVRHGSDNLVRELQGYKWKKDKADNVLEEPVKAMDHACFVGTTSIETDKGVVPMRYIREGDMVLTSQGYKKVLNKWNNGVHLVYKYTMHFDTFSVSLVCTPNHLFKTDKGWIPVSQLQSEMTVYLSSSLMEDGISCILRSDTSPVAEEECTLTHGSISTAKGRPATMYTTSMEIRGTTELKILNSKPLQDTYQNTKNNKTSRSSMKLELRPQLHGTSQKKDCSGTENTLHECNSENLHEQARYANSATTFLSTNRHQDTQSIVILTVKLKHLEQGERMEKPVYDLEVEDAHEYFANGVLVHNCDAMRYAIFTHLTGQTDNYYIDATGNVVHY